MRKIEKHLHDTTESDTVHSMQTYDNIAPIEARIARYAESNNLSIPSSELPDLVDEMTDHIESVLSIVVNILLSEGRTLVTAADIRLAETHVAEGFYLVHYPEAPSPSVP